MFKNIGEKGSKNFIISSGLGLLAALIGSFAVISFVMPAEYWGGSSSVASQNKEFLKTSLGIKAYGHLEVFEFLDKALPSVAAVYRRKPASVQTIDNLYLAKDRLGYGFVLTSDGWIVTGKTVVDGIFAKGLSVAVKGKIYDVKSLVFDAWTEAVFLKVDAGDLAVISLGDSGAVSLGDIVFSGKDKNNFWFSYATAVNLYPDKFNKSDAVISSEKFGKIIKLQDGPPVDLNGGMAVNRNGEVIGLIVANSAGNYILPSNYFKNIVSDVLKNKKVARPYLGVNYIDLNNAMGVNLPERQGAYLYGSVLARAVLADSPAHKAGLGAGDIILSVNGEAISEYKNLTEIISDYKGGEEIVIKFLRGGKEQEAKIVLGSR